MLKIYENRSQTHFPNPEPPQIILDTENTKNERFITMPRRKKIWAKNIRGAPRYDPTKLGEWLKKHQRIISQCGEQVQSQVQDPAQGRMKIRSQVQEPSRNRKDQKNENSKWEPKLKPVEIWAPNSIWARRTINWKWVTKIDDFPCLADCAALRWNPELGFEPAPHNGILSFDGF